MIFSKSAVVLTLAATKTAVVTADKLRGPAVQSGVTDQLHSQADALCNRKEHNSANCSGHTSASGDSCVWCQVETTEGACVSQDDAGYIMDVFKLPCPEYTNLLEAKKEKEGKLPDLMCLAASTDEQLCEQVSASDGSKCVWCAGTHAPSLCFASKDAAFINNKFGLECAMADEAEVEVSDQPNIDPSMIDPSCFMAAWNGDQAEQACGEANAGDGSGCVWCQTEDDTMGICLDSAQAAIADGKEGLSCPSASDKVIVDIKRD